MSKLGLLAGSGDLPAHVAQKALRLGHEVVAYGVDRKSLGQVKTFASLRQSHWLQNPGLVDQHLQRFHADGIRQIVFAGKFHKWILLKSVLRLDKRARQLIKTQTGFNDDAVMQRMISVLEAEGMTVLDQTAFLEDLFLEPGCYTQRHVTEQEQLDVQLGLSLAKEMGRLDVGQTVVVSQGMVLAVETIEGTDQAILRSRRWKGKQGGVVAKVEKPNQDKRFDVPTVGLGTFKAMQKAGLTVLAIEAHKTLVLDRDRMIDFANRRGMTLLAV